MAKGFEGFDPKKRTTHSDAASEAREAAEQEESVRLNLEVPRSLRAAIQKRAIDEGLTMKDLATKILREYLERLNR